MPSGKERVAKALSYEKVDRVPWVPFTGVHCARLLGLDAESYLKNARAIVEGVKKAARQYRADGVCSLFDLQIEAEALGCRLKWSKNNPPAVADHILESKPLSKLPRLAPDAGRIPIALEATRRLVREIGDEIALFGLICGPFTLALHLAGQSFLTDMIEVPDRAFEVLSFCSDVAASMASFIAETGVLAVAVVDPMTSQISPRHFKKFVGPFVVPVIEAIHSHDAKATLFCCGDATKNIALMMDLSPDGVAFDEQVDLALVRDLSREKRVAFEGNLPLTTTLLFGSPKECVEDAKRRLEIAGDEGYILSPGCDIPFDVPPYNLEAIGRFAALGEWPEAESGFQSLEEALSKLDDRPEELKMPEVGADQVFIEIVTLDSEGCAPCQYMVEAVRTVLSRYPGKIVWKETLIKSLAGIHRTQQLGVRTLPTLLIDQEVVFDNLVPTSEQLADEIEKRLQQKKK